MAADEWVSAQAGPTTAYDVRVSEPSNNGQHIETERVGVESMGGRRAAKEWVSAKAGPT